jgi:hypothetical protein
MTEKANENEQRRNEPGLLESYAEVGIRIPGGYRGFRLDPDELEEWNADPDAYAAAVCGLSKFEYLQWIDLDGTPLCGHRNKGGDLCGAIIGRMQMDAHKWKIVHRIECCPAHGGPKKNRRPWG